MTEHEENVDQSLGITQHLEAKVRSNFAVQHMMAAARFARVSHRMEQDNADQPLGPFFDEIISYVSAGVLSAVAAMEANLNELLADIPCFGTTLTDRAFEEIWRDADRRNLLDKYQFVLILRGHPELPRGDAPFQNADVLVKMRNALVHFRPEWTDEQGKHHSIGKQLMGKFKPSPFVDNAPLFPTACMCHACLDWAIKTSREFMREFSTRSGLPFKFDGAKHNFTTTSAPDKASHDGPNIRQPNEWYDLSPEYSGRASIVFEEDNRQVRGTGTYTHTPLEGGKIEFECQDRENSQLFDELFWRGRPGVVLPQGTASPKSIIIETETGTFVADYKVWPKQHTFSTSHASKAAFSAVGGSFRSPMSGQAAHFVMPLYNMLSPAFETWPKPQPECVDNHVLRVFPTPPQISAEDDVQVQIERNWHNRLITLKIDDQIGFIESLPDYADRVKRLREGKVQRLVTAVLVCDAASRMCTSDDPSTWFPVDLLNLLSVATGYRVGAPWIEYRDNQGKLLHRVHVEFGFPVFQAGHPMVLEYQEANTGYFLTQALVSPALQTKVTRLMFTHLMNAGVRGRSIEDRFLSLSRAFEAYATDQKLSVQDIKNGLGPTESSSVAAILQTCVNDLQSLVNTTTDPIQKKSVTRIADKVRSADQRDKSFGEAVGDIADQMGFDDKHVLLQGFAGSNGSNWCAFLSFLRGAVVHEGGFDLSGRVYDAKEIVRVSDHLHDLLIRVFLKILGLQAKYSSPIFPVPMLREIDWVNEQTTARELIVPS